MSSVISRKEEIVELESSHGFEIRPIDVNQIMKLYETMMESVKKDLLIDYKATRISGNRYAEMLAELQKAAMTGSMQSVVSLMSKETNADRCLKRAQCDKLKKELEEIRERILASSAKTTRENSLGVSQIKKTDEEIKLVAAKTKAEDIKNGDKPDGLSLYGYNKKVLDAQDKLYQRQKAGFNDNARQKLYDSSVSTYGIIFQDASLTQVAPPFTDASLQSLFTSVESKIGQ
ncbi:MAG: hypothetical protein J7L15_02540 [Clostridiales bacterium]|nr:hypothetical protein [Clostridiales bacterium]